MPGKALLSCWNKEGTEALARSLTEAGWEIWASGGTAAFLRERGVPARSTEELTGIVSLLGGRVKTLHPAIYSAILAEGADREAMAARGETVFDLVAVDFYPFESCSQGSPRDPEVTELIDIGGPCMIRAAAKNWRHVIPAAGAGCFEEVARAVAEGRDDEEFRLSMAASAFDLTSRYDLAVSMNLEKGAVPGLRYGENPHQAAWIHFRRPAEGFGAAVLESGDSLSYNNSLDASAAWDIVSDMPGDGPAVVLVKHGNPCGAATGSTAREAFSRAFEADRESPYGGVMATRTEVDEDLMEALKGLFLELLLAPSFAPGAERHLAKRKKMRALRMPPGSETRLQSRTVWGAVLLQEPDRGCDGDLPGRIVTARAPSVEQTRALDLAMRVCRGTKSNAIVIADARSALGIGAGQMSRIESLRMALARAARAGLSVEGASLASDGYFPFGDSIEAAAAAGIAAIVQPGGSIRDQEAIAAADAGGLAMVFTGKRHFRH